MLTDWLLQCEQCGKEWRTTPPMSEVLEHEREYGHYVVLKRRTRGVANYTWTGDAPSSSAPPHAA